MNWEVLNMQSKTSFFNKAIFVKNLARFWPLWFAYLATWIVVGPITFAVQMDYADYVQTPFDIGVDILNYASVGVIITFVFAIFAAMAVFSYLYTSKSASMMSSLPITRTEMFMSNYLSGIFAMIAVHVITFFGFALVESLFGCLDIVYLLQWFVLVSMSALFCYSMAALCAVLTGHIIILPVLYSAINFVFVAVEALIKELLGFLIYGYCNVGTMKLMALSPPYQMADYGTRLVHKSTGDMCWCDFDTESMEFFISGTRNVVSYSEHAVVYDGWLGMIIYTFVAIVLVAIALAIFKRRQMETASDVVAVKILKPIFKYAMAFGGALSIGLMLFAIVFAYDRGMGSLGFIALVVFMLIGAFVGYFAAEMLMQKSFRVFKRWKGFVISACIIIALTTACEADLFGYEKNVPAASEIESVEIEANGEEAIFKEDENIVAATEMHESIISNKEVHETADEYDWLNVYISYNMSDGRVIERSYTVRYDLPVDEESDAYAVNKILNTKEAIQYRKQTSIPVTLQNIDVAQVQYYDENRDDFSIVEIKPEQALELYENYIVPEIESGALGRVWLYTDGEYYETVYDTCVTITLNGFNENGEMEYTDFFTYMTKDSVKTNEYLKNFGVKFSLIADGEEEYYKD